jgi:hypothetical protein
MSVLTEKNYLDDVVRYFQDILFSFQHVTVVAVAALVTGTIMAQKTKSVVTEAKASGSGTGTIGEATLGALAVPGVYKIVFTTTGATALADVRTPSGELVGVLTVGTAFVSDHINLTIADGATDWTAGDVVTVTVSGDNKYYPAVYGAVDGTGEPVGILAEDVAITTGRSANMLIRDAIIIPTYLTWPASYDSDPKKATAYASLETKRIYTETNVA